MATRSTAAAGPRDRARLDADPARLGALLAELEPRLRAVALRITRDPESARDVVQSAFEKVVRHAAHFEGRSAPSTWIHRIVANEALMWLRAERRAPRRPEAGLPPLVDPGPDPCLRAERRQRAALLHAGLARLPRAEREVIESCALAGVSYAEFGRRTGTHPGAVKSRAFRARRQLASLLRPQTGPAAGG